MNDVLMQEGVFYYSALSFGLLMGALLMGSIPFGLIVTRIAGLGDIRSIGSGNIGATNVLRTGKKHLAIVTLLLDMAKGGAAVWLADRLGLHAAMFQAIVLFFAVAGHIYSPWLRFKGGKGVSTFAGALIGLSPVVGFSVMGLWAALFFTYRYSSLASLIAAAVAPILVFAWKTEPAWVPCALTSLLVIWRHKENIRRLMKGEELRFGANKESKEESAPAANSPHAAP